MTQYITTYIGYNLLLIIILLSLKFYCHTIEAASCISNICTGNFGVVYKGYYTKEKERVEVAIKTMKGKLYCMLPTS